MRQKTEKSSKEQAILDAARLCFLTEGYSSTSMDALAVKAGVSIRTVYSYFENKEQLFQAIMTSACADEGLFTETRTIAELSQKFEWYNNKTIQGAEQAGITYLQHILSPDHLSLYRVVASESARFPELGRLYDQSVATGRTALLANYLLSGSKSKQSREKSHASALIFEGLLRSGIFEKALCRMHSPTDVEIKKHAIAMTKVFWKLRANL